jgi:tetratricopeptide (TPR) repeat protein
MYSAPMRRCTAILAAFSLVCVAACARESPEPRPRAVVLGIDSADWRVIDPLIAEGRMPNLAALRERGSWGPIQTLVDFPLSPVIWTSVVTGKTPAKHGITWFLVDQPDGTRVPVRSHNRKARALWNILAGRGLRTTSVGWWASYPAEDIGAGTLVSDALGFHGFGRTAREGDDRRKTWPAERFAELDALVPPEQQLPVDFALRFLHLTPEEYRNARFDPARHPKRDPGNPVHLFQQYAVTAQGYTAIAETLLAEPYDLFLLYYEQVDSFSHLFMKHRAPRLEWVNEQDHERFKDVVTEWYTYQDELLGRLLAKIDLDTTAVFLLSDHGFKSGERRIRSEQTVDINTAHLDHEPDGIFLAVGPGIRRGARVEDATVLDPTPTILHYLGLPVGKDMDGKVLAEIFQPASLETHPITYVASYEAEGEAPAPPGIEDYGEAELAENVAALEALGYVKKGASGAGSQPASEADAGESSPEIHNNLARIHARAGELDEAIAEFEKALALNPRDADALLGLASIAAMKGNRTRAEHLAKVAVATNPDFPPALAQLADLRRDAGDLAECTRLYREAIALHDSMPSLYLGLGDCLQRAGQYPEAEAAFTRVRELDPDSFVAVYNLGVTAFQQQREEEAIALYEQAIEMNPNHPLAAAAYNNLGTVQLDRGETEQAITRWEQAVAASPAQFEARFNLASQYLEQGRSGDAIPLLEQAARLAPNHEMLHIRLGGAYMEAGRGEDAFRAFSLVRRLYPDNWFAPLGMAVLFAATERPEQAKPLLDDALRLGGDVARNTANGYPALAPLLDGGGTPHS